MKQERYNGLVSTVTAENVQTDNVLRGMLALGGSQVVQSDWPADGTPQVTPMVMTSAARESIPDAEDVIPLHI